MELRTRNWPALAALWVLGSVWLALIVLIALAGLFDVSIPEAVAWVLLAVAGVGFALALLGISLIRTHGETALAICALVLALSLPSLASTFSIFVFGGIGAGFD